MKKIGTLLLALVMLLSLVSFASAYEVYSSGPLDSVDIQFSINNNGPGTITEVEFSLLTPYVIDSTDSPFNVSAPVGVTGTFFTENTVGTDQFAKFGFTFTGFTNGAGIFSFNWDPDIVGNNSYGTVMSELAGTVATVFTTEGTYFGLMQISGDHLVANFACQPVPVPPAVWLFGSGLLGLGGWRRLRKI